MATKLINKVLLFLSYALVFCLVFFNRESGFFWDTIQLASQHGSYYYTNNFSTLLLPIELDSGHIPAFGIYVAVVWTIFGKTLAVSHLSMLPFALGIVWQLKNLCQRFIPAQYVGVALLLVLTDATLMSQITLVSPDVPLVFFFLLALNSVFNNRKILISIAVFGLFLISMRGMMIAVCLVLLDVYVNYGFTKNISKAYIRSLMKRSLLYWPALLLFVVFSMYHYHEKGWIGYHKDSPWADCFYTTDFQGFIRNLGFLGWRLLDFGRIGVWIVFGILFFKYKKQVFKRENQSLFFFFIIIVFILPLNMLWAKNLMGNRYLLPIYISFSLLVVSVLFSGFVATKLRIGLVVLWLVVSLTGNLWIYPPKISKGSDATLAHLPYDELRRQAIAYIENKQIDFKEVDTFFPNYYSLKDIDLINDKRHFDNYVLGNNSQYIFYSNIFNVDDEVYDFIVKNYKPMKEFKKAGIYVVLFKKQ